MTGQDWVITYRARPKAPVEIWAVIVDVPAGTTSEAVDAAVLAWPRWPQWQARLAPGSVIACRRRRTNDDAGVLLARRAGVMFTTWDELAPSSRRISVEISGELYAAVTTCARVAGQPLSEFVRDCLIGVAMAPAVDAAAGPFIRAMEPITGLDAFMAQQFVEPSTPVGGGATDVPLPEGTDQ